MSFLRCLDWLAAARPIAQVIALLRCPLLADFLLKLRQENLRALRSLERRLRVALLERTERIEMWRLD